MKKVILGCMLLTLVVVHTATAGDVGLFASNWNHEDGDSVWGGGILFVPASLPMEFRGTFYERSDTGRMEASPIDAGLAFNLTRFESVNFSAVGGASYYLVDAEGYSADDEFGWYIGARAEFFVHENYALFGEVLYRDAELDNVDFSGATFNIGMLF